MAAVLARESVPYFGVPSRNERSVIGVAAEDFDRVLRALLAEAAASSVELIWAKPKLTDERDGKPRAEPCGIMLYETCTDPRRRVMIGRDVACVVHSWRREGDRLVTDGGTVIGNQLPAEDPFVRVPTWVLDPVAPVTPDGPTQPTRSALQLPPIDRITFPIDVVYTWVDGDDPQWRERKAAALSALRDGAVHELASGDSRYTARDELRFSLRSLTNAPWVRHVYLVTDGQLPPWLDHTQPGITVVSHRELFAGTGVLPTFNSHAIESRLHNVPGLAEHFLYFNDDMLLGRPVKPSLFFHANGVSKFFESTAVFGLGPVCDRDAPVDAASKNNLRLARAQLGRTTFRKMKHVPYALRRSVLAEIEATLPTEVLATASHQFRHPDDLSIPSSLHHYWAFMREKAVPAHLRYDYVDIGDPFAPIALGRLLRDRRVDAFCVNDTKSDPTVAKQQARMLSEFFEAYFPFRSPFEHPPDVAAQRANWSPSELYAREFEPAVALPTPATPIDDGELSEAARSKRP